MSADTARLVVVQLGRGDDRDDPDGRLSIRFVKDPGPDETSVSQPVIGSEEQQPGFANLPGVGRLLGMPSFPITLGFRAY